MIRKAPGTLESLWHIIVTSIIGDCLLAVAFPSLLATRRWEFREWPVGYAILLAGSVLLISITARLLTAFQRSNIEYRRIVTQGFLLGSLIAVGGYCLSDLTRLRGRMFEYLAERQGWYGAWLREGIDYVLVPLLLSIVGCAVVGAMFRARVKSAHIWKIQFAVLVAGILLTLSAAWARVSYFHIFPNYTGPWVAHYAAPVSAAALSATSFGPFPFAICIFTKLLLRSARR